MQGRVQSLNVSAEQAVTLFEVVRLQMLRSFSRLTSLEAWPE
jgi:hypothetical protein